MTHRDILQHWHPKELQEAQLFVARFQASERCRKFRDAWDIKKIGFKNHRAYKVWQSRLNRRSNEYLQSEQYQLLQEQVREKKLQAAQGLITDFELRWFAERVWRSVPVRKFDYDIVQVTIQENKPEYMCDFIEQCLLFEKPNMAGIIRPSLKPKLTWDGYHGMHHLVIENVFSDTGTKDFDDPRFTRDLKKLQKKLAGYATKKSRLKRTHDYGERLQILDSERSDMRDAEKADALFGEVTNVDFSVDEKRRKGRVRQIRHRRNKRLR